MAAVIWDIGRAAVKFPQFVLEDFQSPDIVTVGVIGAPELQQAEIRDVAGHVYVAAELHQRVNNAAGAWLAPGSRSPG